MRYTHLEGLVETLQDPELLVRGPTAEAVGGQRDDGPVEGLEPQLVEHDAEDVDCNVAALGGRVGVVHLTHAAEEPHCGLTDYLTVDSSELRADLCRYLE
jgi:hypothetical protein